MTEFLHNTNAPFIFMPDENEGRMNAMILQRDTGSKLKLPIVCEGIAPIKKDGDAQAVKLVHPLPGWQRIDISTKSLRKQYTSIYLEVDYLGCAEFLYWDEKGRQLLADLVPAFTYC